jgi:hypothetical protein
MAFWLRRLHGAAGMKLAAVATRAGHEGRADEQKQIFLWERDLHAMRVSKDDRNRLERQNPSSNQTFPSQASTPKAKYSPSGDAVKSGFQGQGRATTIADHHYFQGEIGSRLLTRQVDKWR